MKPKILLVYAALNHPLRANTKNLIECFRQYGDAHWYYLNLAHKSAPAYLAAVEFDLIIFQTTFTQRLSRSDAHYALMVRRAARILDLSAPKAALVQDEFWNVAKVERFIEEFGIERVFSVAPETEWPVLYPSIDPQKVKFHRVLTGYLDDETLDRMIDAGRTAHRSKDVVYRAAGKPSPAWGRLGFLKQRLADAVARLAPQLGLRTDISTDSKDTLFGDDWIKFLANARYTIGVPSGSSLLDRNGEITKCVESYSSAHPDASFEEVEQHCFAGLDGNLRLSAIGPRHIEACATRTCQILVEGDYNGLLLPNIHYLPVKEDLSNLPDVLARLNDDEIRVKIVEAAFDDIVRPQRITYRCFVSEVLGKSLPNRSSGAPLRIAERFILSFMRLVNALEWQLAVVFSGPVRKLRDLVNRGYPT
jgi:hypothetical protein